MGSRQTSTCQNRKVGLVDHKHLNEREKLAEAQKAKGNQAVMVKPANYQDQTSVEDFNTNVDPTVHPLLGSIGTGAV